MSVRATVRSFALPLGVMSGLFALVQVFVSVYAARASGPALRSLHEIFGGVSLLDYLNGSAAGISSNPLPLLGDVLGTMFITYTAALSPAASVSDSAGMVGDRSRSCWAGIPPVAELASR